MNKIDLKEIENQAIQMTYPLAFRKGYNKAKEEHNKFIEDLKDKLINKNSLIDNEILCNLIDKLSKKQEVKE